MKMVFKLMIVFSVIAVLAGLECILNCSCNLVAYPVPQRAKLVDNTKVPEPKTLTLMVYMAADNDLESHAIRNLKAMERADFSNINVLVLMDRSQDYDETNDNWTDTRLFEVTHDTSNGSSIVSKRLDCPPLGLSQNSTTELDMGNYNVLKAFVEFTRETYQAQNYALIIWGHGTGWRYSKAESGPGSVSASRAVAIDDKSNSYICVRELGLALMDQQLCVIGFDTCFGSVFENLYELKDCSQYIVASPGLTPAAGWDYKTLLQELSGTELSAQQIASKMAQANTREITITDTKTLDPLMTELEAFSKALSQTIVDQSTRRSVLDTLIRTKSYSYTQYPCDLYIDIFSMAQAFSQTPDEQLRTASKNLADLSNGIQTGLLLIPQTARGVLSTSHSQDYIKDSANTTQCTFIKQSEWWVPTKSGSSQSVLDKLFYQSFE